MQVWEIMLSHTNAPVEESENDDALAIAELELVFES